MTVPLFSDSLRGDLASKRLVFRSVAEITRTEKLMKGDVVGGKSHNVTGQMLLILPMDTGGQIQIPSRSKRVLEAKSLWPGYAWRPINLRSQGTEGAVEECLAGTTKKPTRFPELDIEAAPTTSIVQTTRRTRQVQQAKTIQKPHSTQQLKPTQQEPTPISTAESMRQSLLNGEQRTQRTLLVDESTTRRHCVSADTSPTSLSGATSIQSPSLLDDTTDEQQRILQRFSLLTPSNMEPQVKPCLPKSDDEVLRFETESIVSLLQLARAHPSPARLQLCFGRLLVHPDSVSKQMRSRPIVENTWAKSRGSMGHLKTAFVSR